MSNKLDGLRFVLDIMEAHNLKKINTKQIATIMTTIHVNNNPYEIKGKPTKQVDILEGIELLHKILVKQYNNLSFKDIIAMIFLNIDKRSDSVDVETLKIMMYTLSMQEKAYPKKQ